MEIHLHTGRQKDLKGCEGSRGERKRKQGEPPDCNADRTLVERPRKGALTGSLRLAWSSKDISGQWRVLEPKMPNEKSRDPHD